MALASLLWWNSRNVLESAINEGGLRETMAMSSAARRNIVTSAVHGL
jgi:hypothetical protein